MKEKISGREILLIALCLFLALYSFLKADDRDKLREEKARSEERIKQYQKEAKQQASITDSLKTKVSTYEGVIAYQKENPKIIIEKYDKARGKLNLLNTDDQIDFLSNRLSKEGSH